MTEACCRFGEPASPQRMLECNTRDTRSTGLRDTRREGARGGRRGQKEGVRETEGETERKSGKGRRNEERETGKVKTERQTLEPP